LVAIGSSLNPRAAQGRDGFTNHPANKREWQWLTMRLASPVFTDGLRTRERLSVTDGKVDHKALLTRRKSRASGTIASKAHAHDGLPAHSHAP
jgi:hypothetical protein